MKYIGLQSQISSNNRKSVTLLIMFPLIFCFLTWIFIYFALSYMGESVDQAFNIFILTVPWILFFVGIWFLIAYLFHSSIINKAAGAAPLERSENKRVYNIVENLSISAGMTMPKVNVIEDDSLNAFASGLNKSNYTVSLSRGIISKLNDEELEAVVAHELTHIRNRDVRLLIVSIVFVGIFAFLTQASLRSARIVNSKKGGGIIVLIIILGAIGWLFTSIFRFALSRKREFLADAGAVELTKNPLALASALEKVSQDSIIEVIQRKDIAQMFIENPQVKEKFSMGLFTTHPPIEKRIEVLRQF